MMVQAKGKYTIGLGQDCMAFCTDIEDIISMSVIYCFFIFRLTPYLKKQVMWYLDSADMYPFVIVYEPEKVSGELPLGNYGADQIMASSLHICVHPYPVSDHGNTGWDGKREGNFGSEADEYADPTKLMKHGSHSPGKYPLHLARSTRIVW